MYRIRSARADDIPLLPAIERAAAQRFRGLGFDALLEGTVPVERLGAQQRDGMLWIAADAQDAPVGFALVLRIDGEPHLEEIDVLPAHAGRGLGRRLLAEVARWAERAGHRTLTLSTFSDVPWNAPFYARLGFRVLGADEIGPGLAALRAAEARRGLPIRRRVLMGLQLPAASGRSGKEPG